MVGDGAYTTLIRHIERNYPTHRLTKGTFPYHNYSATLREIIPDIHWLITNGTFPHHNYSATERCTAIFHDIYIFKIRMLQFCRVPGGFNCSHCKVELHSLQINFTSAQLQLLVGGGLTAVTAKLNYTHCRSTSLQPNFNSWLGGGFDCSDCKVELHSLQINFTSAQLQLLIWGGFDCSHCKVELHSLQINFTPAQLQLLGGGGGFNCSHCKVELHSLQINFT